MLLLLLLAGCSSVPTDRTTSERATDPERESDPEGAPDFEVSTFDGTNFALADHRGTPVVINFWESW